MLDKEKELILLPMPSSPDCTVSSQKFKTLLFLDLLMLVVAGGTVSLTGKWHLRMILQN